MKEVETVAEYCPYDDCIYRLSIDGGRVPICFYAVIEGRARGCKISECDKYKQGTRHRKSMSDYVLWDIDYD